MWACYEAKAILYIYIYFPVADPTRCIHQASQGNDFIAIFL